MKLLLPNIETERLRFRLVEQADFNEWLPMFEQPKVADFLGLDKSQPIQEICTTFFERVFSRYKRGTGGMNALIEKSTGAMVGQCGLMIQNVGGKKYLEVGYAVIPQFWGKGYASEAAIKCRDYAFENELAETLISVINVGNIGSEKVAQKNGMHKIEYIPDYHGTAINRWGIDKSAWLNLR
jgi:ribosomal-protein-alanine N-acetyltransferase